MALHWVIDSRQSLLTATAVGEVSHADVDAGLTEILSLNVMAWRRLIDLTEARFTLTAVEILALGARIRAANSSGNIGALALILPKAEPENVMPLLGFFAAAQRPMRIFKSVAPALQWIMLQRQKKPTLPQALNVRCADTNEP